MNCNAFRNRYESYIADELSVGLAEQFEEHVSQCADCREWFEMQQIAGDVLRQTAEDSLPPEHYFEGLFQRVAPRLVRVKPGERIRQVLTAPFAAIFFSNRLGLRIARAAALCLAGAGIALAITGQDLSFNFGAAKKAPSINFNTTKTFHDSGPSVAAATERDAVKDTQQFWREFSNLMQHAITPKMADSQVQPMAPAPAAVSLFSQIDSLKFNMIREGSLNELPRVMKLEADLLAVGQITEAESQVARQQCQLVQQALAFRSRGENGQMESALQQVVQLKIDSRWACHAKYLLANLYEAQGQISLAVTLYNDCLANYPADSLNATQQNYARERVAHTGNWFLDKFTDREK